MKKKKANKIKRMQRNFQYFAPHKKTDKKIGGSQLKVQEGHEGQI